MFAQRQASFCRIGEVSRVGLLRGQYVGCGLKDDISIPHLVNWRTQQEYPLAREPDVRASPFDIVRTPSN